MEIELTREDGTIFSIEAAAIRSYGSSEESGRQRNYIVSDKTSAYTAKKASAR